jgi:hypothetical protein
MTFELHVQANVKYRNLSRFVICTVYYHLLYVLYKKIVNYHGCTIKDHWEMDLHAKLNQGLLSILYKPEKNIGFHWITSYILYNTIAGVEYYFDVPHRVTEILI